MNLRQPLALAALLLGTSAYAQTAAPTWQSPPTPPPQEQLSPRLSFNVGGGVEGYTGQLNDRINPGPTWMATLDMQALPWLSGELGYTGAVNEVDNRVATGEGIANGADIVRNGGHIAAAFNIPTPIVQPYALAGIGFDHYDARGGAELGYRDDNAGRVPLGGGLRANVAGLNADARFTYNALFSDEVSSPGNVRTTGGGYTASLQIGGRF